MALQHEFVLRDEIPKPIRFRDFDMKEMTIISDEFILGNYVVIKRVRMYNPSLDEYVNGLEYHGNTVLEPESAKQLKKALLDYCQDSEDRRNLVDVLDQAIDRQCYVIHFGV